MKLSNLHEMDVRLRQLERSAVQGDLEARKVLNQWKVRKGLSGEEIRYEEVQRESEREYQHYLGQWRSLSEEERSDNWSQFVKALPVRGSVVLYDWLDYPTDIRHDRWGVIEHGVEGQFGQGWRVYFGKIPSVVDLLVSRHASFGMIQSFVQEAKNKLVPIKPLPSYQEFVNLSEVTRLSRYTFDHLIGKIEQIYR